MTSTSFSLGLGYSLYNLKLITAKVKQIQIVKLQIVKLQIVEPFNKTPKCY